MIKVACLLVTRERRLFAQRAVEYFDRQTYKNRELVVVESGDRLLFDPLVYERKLLLIQCERGLPHTAGLSLAHRNSDADVFVHWDDDDWQHPERLERIVDDLKDHDASHTTNVLAFDVLSGRGFCWPGHSMMACGSSLAYRRELVERFPWNTDLPRGGDTEWVNRVRHAGVHIHNSGRGDDFIYVLHHRNVTPTIARVVNALDDEATTEVRNLMGVDARWYDELAECLPPRRKGTGDFANVFFSPWAR